MATATAYESKGFFYFMNHFKMSFEFIIEERAEIYLLLKTLKSDHVLNKKCDYFILIDFFERFIDESNYATFIDPFQNNEL